MQALKKEPKVMRMAYLVFGCTVFTSIVVLGFALKSAGTLFMGIS